MRLLTLYLFGAACVALGFWLGASQRYVPPTKEMKR